MFMPNSRVEGGHFVIGDVERPGPVLIAEGYATAATLHELTGMPAIVAFNAGNLVPVAQTWRQLHPDRPIYIAGDNDHRREAEGKPNVGREKAEEAAAAIGGFALLPAFAEQDAGTDWNDLARRAGQGGGASAAHGRHRGRRARADRPGLRRGPGHGAGPRPVPCGGSGAQPGSGARGRAGAIGRPRRLEVDHASDRTGPGGTAGVLTAGFVGFFVMLAYAAGLLLLLACGFACAGFLLVALFSMVMWLFTRDAHAFRMMLGYFAYAGGMFAVIAALAYYHGKLLDGVGLRGTASYAPADRSSFDWRKTPPLSA